MVTDKRYLDDSFLARTAAPVVAVVDDWVALAATVFHPGGGGQPADRGELVIDGRHLPVATAREDDERIVWHQVRGRPPLGGMVEARLDWDRRYDLMRSHALMHVVNTIAVRRYGALLTGVQLAVGRSRVDLHWEGASREELPEFERQVNAVIEQDLAVSHTVIADEEFRARPELIRTLNVAPPVVDGRVRVVEIAGFDAQACGGTHVHRLGEIGPARIVGFENKGRQNKRLVWALE
jgi:misacylated tRNA(Ala) deacylase